MTNERCRLQRLSAQSEHWEGKMVQINTFQRSVGGREEDRLGDWRIGAAAMSYLI